MAQHSTALPRRSIAHVHFNAHAALDQQTNCYLRERRERRREKKDIESRHNAGYKTTRQIHSAIKTAIFSRFSNDEKKQSTDNHAVQHIFQWQKIFVQQKSFVLFFRLLIFMRLLSLYGVEIGLLNWLHKTTIWLKICAFDFMSPVVVRIGLIIPKDAFESPLNRDLLSLSLRFNRAHFQWIFSEA